MRYGTYVHKSRDQDCECFSVLRKRTCLSRSHVHPAPCTFRGFRGFHFLIHASGEGQSSHAEVSGEFYFRLTNRSRGVVLMPTLQEQDFFSELAAGHSGPPIPESKRVYFQTRLRNRLFDYIVGRFVREQKKGLTKAALARRIGKSPEVINRW